MFSARLIPDSLLAQRYEPVLAGRDEFISFQTLAEVLYGAQLRNWGAARLRRLEATVAKTEVVHSGDELIREYVNFRVACERIGHALHQREHDADRWIAATAIRLGIPLVSNDGIFEDAPGLQWITVSA